MSASRTRLRGDTGGGKLYPALVVVFLLLSTGFAAWIGFTEGWWIQDAPLNTFQPKGENSRNIHDNMVVPMFIAAAVVFVLVEGVILYTVFARRVSEDEWASEDDFPKQSHGNTTLEITWTGLPFLVMVGIAFLMWQVQTDLNDFADEPLEVEVWGAQWWWEYRYDTDGDGQFGEADDIRTANELVIPAGTEVELLISSTDVIHSYWIPELNGKKDAVPGFQSRWKIAADEPGRYRGTCTEFCGLSHARMQMYAIALSAEDYAAWEANQLTDAAERTEADFEDANDPEAAFTAWQDGRDLFESACASCHNIRGVAGPNPDADHPLVSGIAPDLTHLMSRDTFAGSTRVLWEEVATGEDLRDTLDGETPAENYLSKDGLVVETEWLEEWLRNPQDVKPAAPDEGRGMPNLNLSPDQIDDLVAYLTTLE